MAERTNAKAKSREDTYQARTEGNIGSYVGGAAGAVLPWMAGVGALRAAGALPKVASTAQKVGLLAGEGALMGAAQPVVSGDSFAKSKATQVGVGAATGPILMGAAKAAGGVKNVADQVFRPQVVADANVARLFGSDAQTLAKLRGGQQYVPGEIPSAAQLLQTPEAVLAERMLRNNPASAPAFANADNANNAARMDVIKRLAGDDA